jgi:DNA-binding ferritin-like protein
VTDAIAERARKIGGTTLRSIGQISRFQRIADNDAEYVKPLDTSIICLRAASDLLLHARHLKPIE